MAKSFISIPSAPVWGGNRIIFLKIKTDYYNNNTSSAGIIDTGIDPARLCSVVPISVEETGVVSRDLQLTMQPKSDGSSMLIIAKHRDGTIWANTEISYRIVYFDEYQEPL